MTTPERPSPATVLVIDDDPTARAYVRAALPVGWSLLEAADGLSGLDLVRQRLRDLALIVLDMQLPDLEGRSVCIQIRYLSPTVPILPFTAAVQAAPVLHELACLAPVLKPARPERLAEAIRAALGAGAPPLLSSPLLGWAHEQSTLLEQIARQQSQTRRVAVFASSGVTRAGLARLLDPLAQTAEAASPAALRRLLREGRWTALVADAADYPHVLEAARERGVPLVLVAASVAQAQALRLPDVAAVVLDTDPAIEVKLARVLEALVQGEVPSALLTDDLATQRAALVPPQIGARLADTPLTPREQEVLWLDAQGCAAAQIAELLCIDPDTVKSHWKRIQRKLGLDRAGVRAWLHARLHAERAVDEEL